MEGLREKVQWKFSILHCLVDLRQPNPDLGGSPVKIRAAHPTTSDV